MAVRRTIRESLRRYGDRPDKATTVEHYEAEAAEQTGVLMALRDEWEDGYRAGWLEAAKRVVIAQSSGSAAMRRLVDELTDPGADDPRRWHALRNYVDHGSRSTVGTVAHGCEHC